MIINVYSMIMLFLAILTGLLALILGPLSFRVYQMWGRQLSAEQRTAVEKRSYLLLLIAVVILSVKLLSWPFFYVTLQSYIPSIQGAMCIFGVTQVHPYLSGMAQILKPMLFLLIGAWLLLNRLDRTTETAPLSRRKFLFLAVVSLMVLADSAGDLSAFTRFRVEADVTCCTGFFDLPGRTTALVSASLLGQSYEPHLLPLYYFSSISLVLFPALCYARFLHRSSYKGFTETRSLTLSGTGVILSVVNAVVTVLALFEVIAPRVMELPSHHCIYCMWQDAPHSIVLTALFVVGTMAPIWAFLLHAMGRHEETMERLRIYLENLYLFGVLGIGASMGIVTVDLLRHGLIR